MYTQYTYLNTATLEQIHDDIFELFCGEATVSNLSASCDDANTFILTTYSVSPWVDFDDVSTTERIMRLEIDDDTGVYKYVGWHSGGSNELSFAVMESWDAGTDSATNEHPVDFTYHTMGVFPTTGGTIHIYSSQYATFIMHESTTDLWGNTSTPNNLASLGIFECSRDHPALTTGAGGMPNWFMANTAMVWGDSDVNMDAIFYKMRDNTDTVQIPYLTEMGYPGRDNARSDESSYAITGALGSATALPSIGALTRFGLEPIMVGSSPPSTGYANSDHYVGNVSARCDIWLMPVGSSGVGTLVHINGLPYFVFKMGYTTGTLGNQFGGKLVAPYG